MACHLRVVIALGRLTVIRFDRINQRAPDRANGKKRCRPAWIILHLPDAFAKQCANFSDSADLRNRLRQHARPHQIRIVNQVCVSSVVLRAETGTAVVFDSLNHCENIVLAVGDCFITVNTFLRNSLRSSGRFARTCFAIQNPPQARYV